jgi:hypothetical protein
MSLEALLVQTDLAGDGARAIQLALTPVFLLTGIAGLLNVMTGRLSRIIDRARYLTETPPSADVLSPTQRAEELRSLDQRRHLTGRAINACTLAALLTCVVVVLLFAEVLLSLPLKWFDGALFTAATVTLVVGLGHFLREVHLATRTVRFTMPDPSGTHARSQRPS